MASNNGRQSSWLNAIRDESNNVVKNVVSAATNSSLFRSSIGAPQQASTSQVEMINVAEVEAAYNGMQPLKSTSTGDSVSAIEKALEPVWHLNLHQLALLKAKLDRHEWLYESTIASPLTGGFNYPFYNLANMVFRSPLRLTYREPAKVIVALSSFEGMKRAGALPESRVDWPVHIHKHAEQVWVQTIEEWQVWLDLLTRQGFVPDMKKINTNFNEALYPIGVANAPDYVTMWYLTRYGNIPLRVAVDNEGSYAGGRWIGLFDRMAPTMDRAVALYAMCDSLNVFETKMQAYIKSVTRDPQLHGRFVHIFYFLCQYGADTRQLQRFLSLGVPMKQLTPGMLVTIFVRAINLCNFAVLDALHDYLGITTVILRTPEEVMAFLPTFIQLRRDMWPYVLGDTSGEMRAFIIREAKEVLGFDRV